MLKGMKRGRTEFGRRMHQARKHAKLTQIQAGKKIGVSQSTLSEAENESHSCTFVVRAAAVYKVSALWLEKGEGHMLDTGDFFAPQPSKAIQELVIAFESIPPGKVRERAWTEATAFFRRAADFAARPQLRLVGMSTEPLGRDQQTEPDKSPAEP